MVSLFKQSALSLLVSYVIPFSLPVCTITLKKAVLVGIMKRRLTDGSLIFQLIKGLISQYEDIATSTRLNKSTIDFHQALTLLTEREPTLSTRKQFKALVAKTAKALVANTTNGGNNRDRSGNVRRRGNYRGGYRGRGKYCGQPYNHQNNQNNQNNTRITTKIITKTTTKTTIKPTSSPAFPMTLQRHAHIMQEEAIQGKPAAPVSVLSK